MLRLINAEKQDLFSFKGTIKIFVFLPALILLASCQQKAINDKPALKPREVKSRIKKSDTILNSTIGYVDKHRFTVICTSGYNLCVFNEKGDSIYQDSIYSQHQKFIDFNGDGYKDILIEYMTNTPDIMDLLIYNKAERTYKKVIDFQNFPAPQRIANSNYYYSYHRSGCADRNWDSDLFYIKDYKAVKIGNISGQECNDRAIKNGIYINKIVNKNQIEITRFPINIIKKYKEYKWGFIKQYWQKNYKAFIV